jgi:hypothetical protein
MEDWLAFAQRRERLSFKWALASAVSGTISLMIVAVSFMRKTDWLQPSGIVASAAALILLISAVVFPLSFLAWLVWMRRRRKFSQATVEAKRYSTDAMEPSDPLAEAQKRERLCFKTALVFASGGTLSFLATQGVSLWFQWVIKPAAIHAHRMGDPHAAEDFFAKKRFSEPFFLGAAAVILVCMACFAICFVAWLVWMTKRRRLEASAFHSH